MRAEETLGTIQQLGTTAVIASIGSVCIRKNVQSSLTLSGEKDLETPHPRDQTSKRQELLSLSSAEHAMASEKQAQSETLFWTQSRVTSHCGSPHGPDQNT